MFFRQMDLRGKAGAVKMPAAGIHFSDTEHSSAENAPVRPCVLLQPKAFFQFAKGKI
jgi:hypothetical protein